MKRTSTILLAIGLTLALLPGCGTVQQAGDEGANAVKSGMKTKEQARDIAATKEKFDRQTDDF